DLALVQVPVVYEVGLEPHDRLDAVLLGRLDQLDGAVHDAVVGQADGRLVEGRGARGQRVDLAGAVEEGVLRVDVEVGTAVRAHGKRKARCGVGCIERHGTLLSAPWAFRATAGRSGARGEQAVDPRAQDGCGRGVALDGPRVAGRR